MIYKKCKNYGGLPQEVLEKARILSWPKTRASEEKDHD
jgi:hypothetical protein